MAGYVQSDQVPELVSEYRKTILQIIGGLVVAVGLWLTWRRIVATEKTVIVSEEGQITERFTRAIEQLGSDRMAIRLGGIYALERIAKDSEKDYWTVMEVLSAFVRENAPIIKHAENVEDDRSLKKTVQTDIQAILTVIGRRSGKDKGRIALDKTDLSGADLGGAHLERAYLTGVCLRAANLSAAHLEEAILEEAHLKQADLMSARLEKANLDEAHLQGADLTNAHLENAMLHEAYLQGADLTRAKLTNAEFVQASLLQANLSQAVCLQADLRGADLRAAILNGADFTRADFTAAKFAQADLRGAILDLADFRSCKDVTAKRLCSARSLKNVMLPELLHNEALQLCPNLFDLQSSPQEEP